MGRKVITILFSGMEMLHIWLLPTKTSSQFQMNINPEDDPYDSRRNVGSSQKLKTRLTFNHDVLSFIFYSKFGLQSFKSVCLHFNETKYF